MEPVERSTPSPVFGLSSFPRKHRAASLNELDILVYQDAGTNPQSSKALASELTAFPHRKVRYITSEELRDGDWEGDTSLLVMGGGVCSIWEGSLGKEGMERIHRYVVGGGRYFGVCAGGYFGARKSHYTTPTIEIVKERPVDLFPVCAVGPLVFDTRENSALSLDAARAIDVITIDGRRGLCYYQGGCTFQLGHSSDVPPSERVTPLTIYDSPFTGPSTIGCCPGQGRAVATGLHPEFSWVDPPASPEKKFNDLSGRLTPQEPFRKQLLGQVEEFLFSPPE